MLTALASLGLPLHFLGSQASGRATRLQSTSFPSNLQESDDDDDDADGGGSEEDDEVYILS